MHQKLDSKIFINPNLQCYYISDGFYYIVNPCIKDGGRIVSAREKAILDSLSETRTPSLTIKNKKAPEDAVCMLISRLIEIAAISNTERFDPPLWPLNNTTLNLWVQTTNECNLRCSYCYINTLGQKVSLTPAIFNTFCDSLISTAEHRNLKLIRLRLAGGEPILKFSLWKHVIPHLRSRLQTLGCKLKVSVLTNGLIVNDDIIDFLINNQIGVFVSIDGIDSFQNATRHFKDGSGSFNIVSDNIVKLMSHGINPSLMTVVSNENMDGLVSFTSFVIDARLHARYSFVTGENLNIPRLIKVLSRCYDLFDSAIDNGFQFTKLHQLCDLKFDEPWSQTCSSGLNGGALYTNGDLYFCQRQFGVEKPLGSILENDDILTILRRKTYFGDTSVDCKSCKYQYICTSGCPLERIDGKDPHCEVYKAVIPIIYRLRGKECLRDMKQLQSRQL